MLGRARSRPPAPLALLGVGSTVSQQFRQSVAPVGASVWLGCRFQDCRPPVVRRGFCHWTPFVLLRPRPPSSLSLSSTCLYLPSLAGPLDFGRSAER